MSVSFGSMVNHNVVFFVVTFVYFTLDGLFNLLVCALGTYCARGAVGAVYHS